MTANAVVGLDLSRSGQQHFYYNPFLIIESWGGGLGPRGIWGGVQGVGQVAWVNTRPLVCDTPYGMASGGQEEPFSRLALAV